MGFNFILMIMNLSQSGKVNQNVIKINLLGNGKGTEKTIDFSNERKLDYRYLLINNIYYL